MSCALRSALSACLADWATAGEAKRCAASACAAAAVLGAPAGAGESNVKRSGPVPFDAVRAATCGGCAVSIRKAATLTVANGLVRPAATGVDGCVDCARNTRNRLHPIYSTPSASISSLTPFSFHSIPKVVRVGHSILQFIRPVPVHVELCVVAKHLINQSTNVYQSANWLLRILINWT